MESTKGFDDFRKAFGKLSGMISGIEEKRREIIQNLAVAKSSSTPDKLHHYTTIGGISGIVQTNCLWATDFRSLNDRTELIYGSKLLVSELDRLLDDADGHTAKLLRWLADFYHQHADSYRNFFETYIISLSEAPDILSQWRAYSDHAKGCCIEFDLTDSRLFTIVNKNTPWALELLPVIYDETAQRALIQSGLGNLLGHIKPIVDDLSEAELGVISGSFIHALEPFTTAFKHPGFHEEREWRAVSSCQKTITTTTKKTRETESGTCSYVECIFVQGDSERLWQRNLLPISAIKYGPLAEHGVKEAIPELLSANGYTSQVSYSDSRIPLRN